MLIVHSLETSVLQASCTHMCQTVVSALAALGGGLHLHDSSALA